MTSAKSFDGFYGWPNAASKREKETETAVPRAGGSGHFLAERSTQFLIPKDYLYQDFELELGASPVSAHGSRIDKRINSRLCSLFPAK